MSKIIDIDREKEMKKGREGNSDTKKETNNVFIERIKTRLNNNRVRGKKKDKKIGQREKHFLDHLLSATNATNKSKGI